MRTETRPERALTSAGLLAGLLVAALLGPAPAAANGPTLTIKVAGSPPMRDAGLTVRGTADPESAPATQDNSFLLTVEITDKNGAVRGLPVLFRAPVLPPTGPGGRTVTVGTVQDALTQTDANGRATARLDVKRRSMNEALTAQVDSVLPSFAPTQPGRLHSALVDADEKPVSDRDLARWVKEALTKGGQANVLNAILLFQTCFSGGMLDDLKSEIGAAFPWIAGSAASQSELSWYFGAPVDFINKQITAIDRVIQAIGIPRDAQAQEALNALRRGREAAQGALQAALLGRLPETLQRRPHGYWTSALLAELSETRAKNPPVPMLTLLVRTQRRDPVGPAGTRAETGNYLPGPGGTDIVLGDANAKRFFVILWAGQADLLAHFHDIDQMEQAIRARAGARPVDIRILFGKAARRPPGIPVPAGAIDATRQNLQDAITRVKNNIGPEDQFIFYASGHGTYFSDPPQLAPAHAANRSVFAVAPRVLLGSILTGESTPTVSAAYRDVASPDLAVRFNGLLLGHLDPSRDSMGFPVPREVLGTCAVVTIQSDDPGQDYEYKAAVTFSPGGLSPVFVDAPLPEAEACPDVISLLSPLSAVNPQGAALTVAARLVDDEGVPLPGRETIFRVVSGPNAGQAGSTVTGAQGEASFTYVGQGSGIDQIRAFAEDRGVAVLTNSAVAEWTQPSSVAALTGSASRIGLVPAPGTDAGAQVRISMRLAFDGPINLGGSALAIHRLLHEAGGAGELAEGTDGAALLPIVLAPKPGGTWTDASYDTLSRSVPRVRVDIHARGQGLYDLTLRVDRATMPGIPRRCAANGRPATDLTLNFVLDDGLNPAVAVSSVASWRCLDLVGGDPARPRSLRTP